MEPEKQEVKNIFTAENMLRWYRQDLKHGKMFPKKKHEVIKPKIKKFKP